MNKSTFINREQELPEGLDFDFLKKKGLEYIQKLAGNNWTDFNAHDPGITILEQIVFALTELGYKSNLDFLDLLASQKNTSAKNTFFTASQILTTNPLTPNDFRKIIIDRVKGINNIWILPLNSFTRRKNIKGLYLALLEIDPKVNRDPEEVRLETKKKLNYYSNLGEAFEEVFILKKQEIYLRCDIDLEKSAIAEEVHAEVLFELQNFITRPLKYCTLNEMLDQGHSIDELFEGPSLDKGFIDEDCLDEKNTVFFNNQILNKLRTIKGIKTVKKLNLIVETENEYGKIEYKDYLDELSQKEVREFVLIRWDSVGVLGSKLYGDVNDYDFFNYSKDDLKIRLHQKEVDQNFKKREAKVKYRYSQKEKQKYDLEIPKGRRYNDLGDYYSIQHQFPVIYGLFKNAIVDNTSSERKAQIYQLKGYLLFFEQILANYLEQLTRFNELYALDKELDKTYFVKIPMDVPNIHELINKLDTTEDPKKIEAAFQKKVEKMMSAIDDFHERRSKFIRHLLVRFGDSCLHYVFDKFVFYSKGGEHKTNLLNRNIDLLENYYWLSKDKAKSFDHSAPFWDEGLSLSADHRPNLSILERKIRYQLDLSQKVEKIATKLTEKVKIERIHSTDEFQSILEQFPITRLRYMGISSKALWENEGYENEEDEDLIEQITINEDLFKRGIWESNLKVVSYKEEDSHVVLYKMKITDDLSKKISKVIESRGEKIVFSFAEEYEKIEISFEFGGNHTYYLEFLPDHTGKIPAIPTTIWKVLASYQTEETAIKAAYSLKNNLVKWNKQSEGFYVLDHILLRPRNQKVSVNILLNDPTSDWSFRLFEDFEFSELENGIKSNVKILRQELYEIAFNKEKCKYYIFWKNEKQERIGRCNQKYGSESEAKAKAEEIKIYFQHFTDFDIHDITRIKLKREINDRNEHPLHHYSFTLTVFLSEWTARFSDPEFRHLLESTFRENTPAHIALQFKWINTEKMLAFEQLYSDWLDQNRKPSIDFKQLNKLSNQLLTFAKEA